MMYFALEKKDYYIFFLYTFLIVFSPVGVIVIEISRCNFWFM